MVRDSHRHCGRPSLESTAGLRSSSFSGAAHAPSKAQRLLSTNQHHLYWEWSAKLRLDWNQHQLIKRGLNFWKTPACQLPPADTTPLLLSAGITWYTLSRIQETEAKYWWHKNNPTLCRQTSRGERMPQQELSSIKPSSPLSAVPLPRQVWPLVTPRFARIIQFDYVIGLLSSNLFLVSAPLNHNGEINHMVVLNTGCQNSTMSCYCWGGSKLWAFKDPIPAMASI